MHPITSHHIATARMQDRHAEAAAARRHRRAAASEASRPRRRLTAWLRGTRLASA